MNTRSSRLLLCLGLASLCPVAHAALIWKADFASYDTSGGAVALTVNTTGDDDTFTAAIPNANLSSPAQRISDTGAPAFMSGNALFIGGTSTAANISFALQQNAIASVGSSGVLIASFDLYNTSASIVSITAEARTGTGRSGSTTFSSNTPTAAALRVTIVINKTGSSIMLPGSLGSLATDSIAIYRFDGTAYSGYAATSGVGNTVTGFATGLSLGSSTVGASYGLWLDNFGAWNAVTDSVDGVSVLALAPGASASPVPEPARAASAVGVAALGAVVLRRKPLRRTLVRA